MGKSSIAGLLVLLCASAAHAQEGLPPAPPPPAVAPIVALPASPPPSERIPPAFFARFLSYDAAEKQVLMGQQRRPLSREEVFTEMGRPDLLAKSRAAERRRLILTISGVGVLSTGLITAAVARLGMPNLNGGFCTRNHRNYNEICVPDAQRRETISAAAVVVGVGVGGLLGTLAVMSSPNILSKDEVEALIAGHNATLMRRLRSRADALRPKLTPVASWKGGGLALSFQF